MGLKFRRGTTAQKSGSLAFGEPYVNTDLGTLQIGGATGDITLGASGTGSQGTFSGISGSSLDITGNAKIDGNLTLGGAITIGDASADTVNVVASLSSSLIPQTTNAFDLGSQTKIWKDLYISTGSIKFVDGAGAIAARLTAEGLQNISSSAITFSQMAARIVLNDTANVIVGNQSISGNILITGSIIPGVSNAYDLGSATKIWRDLYISTGSIKIINPGTGTVVGTITSNASGEVNTGTQNVSGSLNVSGSFNMTGSIIPGATNTYDLGSPSKQFRHLYISTGSLYMNGTAILSSNATDLTLTTDNGQSLKLLETAADTITLQTAEGNLTLTSTGAGDVILDPNTGVIALKGTTTLYAGNKIVSSDGNAIQIGNNVAITGSLTTTTGLTVGGDFVVNGTTTTIDSTNINIGDNIIVLNGTLTTNGGIYVKDAAGGNTATGSILWDTTNDKWIAGPKGSELAILRAGGDSVVSGSSQITYASISSIPAGIVSGSSQITYTSISSIPGGIVSGSSQVLGGTTIHSGSFFNGISVVSGSSQITYTSISSIPGGIVSGSAQTIANLPTGTVSGSSQVTLSSTTGYGTVINQNLLTTSDVRHNSLGVGMAASATAGRIDASGDVVAYSTSDKNFKENITPIENPIEKIKMISGNTYDWKADMKEFHGFEGNDVGVIAQEIEAVLPQLVTTRETGYKAVKYDKLVALLIEGIKEQQSQIEKLRMDLDNYECKCDNCKSK